MQEPGVTPGRTAGSHWRFPRAGHWWLPALLSCVLFLTIADEANAMGKMCLFSAVKGVVLDHGKPVEGAVIERSYEWAWKGQSGERQRDDRCAGCDFPCQ
jgi:hypothetical protein